VSAAVPTRRNSASIPAAECSSSPAPRTTRIPPTPLKAVPTPIS